MSGAPKAPGFMGEGGWQSSLQGRFSEQMREIAIDISHR